MPTSTVPEISVLTTGLASCAATGRPTTATRAGMIITTAARTKNARVLVLIIERLPSLKSDDRGSARVAYLG
jgi:hypothetical protein